MRRAIILGLLLLSACNRGQVAESSTENIRSRAEALARGADATNDELINQVNAEAQTVPQETKPAAKISSPPTPKR